MVERGISPAERPAGDVDFHRWLAERNRHRATRLGWALIALAVVGIATVGLLMMRLDDATEKYDATRAQVQALDRRLDEAISQRRAADRSAGRTARCLEDHVAELSHGLRRLLERDITIATYIRVHGRSPRCR